MLNFGPLVPPPPDPHLLTHPCAAIFYKISTMSATMQRMQNLFNTIDDRTVCLQHISR